MAHGLSKLINFDEETQQFVEEFEQMPDNMGTDGQEEVGNVLDHMYINSFDQDEEDEKQGLLKKSKQQNQVNMSQEIVFHKKK